MNASRVDGARERILQHDDDDHVSLRRPAPRETPSTRLQAAIQHAPDQSYPAELFACGGTPASATSVTARADRDRPMRLDGGTSQTERLANLGRLTQVDGDLRTSTDAQTCGVQCIIAGLYVQNPAGLQRVAAMELTKNGDKLDTWAKSLGMDPARARADLAAIRDGHASPRQLAVLSQILLTDLRSRTTMFIGTSARQLETLTKDILVKDSGVPAPQMRLELRKLDDGKGHWTAELDVATMADVQENAKHDAIQVFDPWPGPGGLAPRQVTMSAAAARALHPGSREEEHRIAADGSIRQY